jgi:hypothetical protein
MSSEIKILKLLPVSKSSGRVDITALIIGLKTLIKFNPAFIYYYGLLNKILEHAINTDIKKWR